MTATPPALSPFDLVIFDLDGTLVDSLPDIAWALNATLADAGLPTLALDTVSTLIGDGAAKLIERALPDDLPAALRAERHASLLAQFDAIYGERVCVDSRLYPGVAQLLSDLVAAQVTLAVLTNKRARLARDLLDRLGVAEQLRGGVVGDGDGFDRKPDPAAARHLIREAAVSAARTAIVGDGLADVRTGRAVICPVVAAGWGYGPAAALRAERPTFFAPSVGDAARILLPPGARAG